MPLTSSSVNPNLSSDLVEKTSFTSTLFHPENMLAWDTLVTPVT